MKVIRARNINDAWSQAKHLLNQNHIVRPSRVGEVIECPEPVTTVYERTQECVLFDPKRNCNVVFQFMEAMHMLAGRNDVKWLEQFNSKIRDFVGPADIQHGAYGHRERFAFDLEGGAEDGYADQLAKCIRMLKANQNERRAVIMHWNPIWDLERPDVADVPCNVCAFLKIRNGALDITVCCRSNDVLFGAYGSNIVQFSFLQRYLAEMIGVPVGTYYQISDSWHAYTSRWEEYGGLDTEPSVDPYNFAVPENKRVRPFEKLIDNRGTFDDDLRNWIDSPMIVTGNDFLKDVADPLRYSWIHYKAGDLKAAIEIASVCRASDWRLASMQWYERILAKREKKQLERV